MEDYKAERQQEPLLNYDDEARKLFAQLNLPDPMNEKDKTQATFSAESNMPNAVWIHPETKAQLFVSGEYAAYTKELLEENKIFNIVCAKGNSGKLYFKDDPKFTYLMSEWAESLPRS